MDSLLRATPAELERFVYEDAKFYLARALQGINYNETVFGEMLKEVLAEAMEPDSD